MTVKAKNLTTIGMILLLAATALMFAVHKVRHTASWRYKMTIVVETPEGIKTGSAVREVTSVWTPIPKGVSQQKVRGEAVMVDLGKRGKLYAPMAGVIDSDDYGHSIVFNTFPLPGKPPGVKGGTPEGLAYYRRLKNVQAVLEPDRYPLLVHFRDDRDPKTMELVYEQDVFQQPIDAGGRVSTRLKADHFERIYGKGVRLKEITLEMTDEPVTFKLDKHLPSFDPETGFADWFDTLNFDDPVRIGPWAFRKGSY